MVCVTLALDTAGVAMAGQGSHSRGHSSFGRHDHGQTWDGASGVITALGTNAITLKDRHGTSTVLTSTDTTTYFEGSTAGTVTDLAVGEQVNLALTSTTPQTVTKVVICLTKFVGKVSVVTGDTIAITNWKGTAFSVVVSGTTTYTPGGAAPTLGAAVVGAQIEAVGLGGTTAGTLNANRVNILVGFNHGPVPAVGTGHGEGHGHGHGHGFGHGRH